MSNFAPRKSKERRIIPLWVKAMVGIMVISQIIAHIQYWREKAKYWEHKAKKPPEQKIIEKEVIKERVIEKRVYINRAGRDVTDIVEYTKKKFGSQATLALAIFTAESGLDPQAVNYNSNGSVDRGIAQINSCHCHWVDCSRLFDWKYNIDVAYQLSRGGQNWNAWVAYKRGLYKKYIYLF